MEINEIDRIGKRLESLTVDLTCFEFDTVHAEECVIARDSDVVDAFLWILIRVQHNKMIAIVWKKKWSRAHGAWHAQVEKNIPWCVLIRCIIWAKDVRDLLEKRMITFFQNNCALLIKFWLEDCNTRNSYG